MHLPVQKLVDMKIGGWVDDPSGGAVKIRDMSYKKPAPVVKLAPVDQQQQVRPGRRAGSLEPSRPEPPLLTRDPVQTDLAVSEVNLTAVRLAPVQAMPSKTFQYTTAFPA